MPDILAFTPSAYSRRTAIGLSDGAQGADGVPQLAASAYDALMRAQWAPDDSAASIPTHAYDRPAPSGDAFKAVYGYEAGTDEGSTGTERSVAGAVCYTYALPADAVEQLDGAASCLSVSALVTGDRYLDAGACLVALLSDARTPPPLAEFLSSPLAVRSAAVCATAGQTDADGKALTPPYRTGQSAAALCTFPDDTMPLKYLHLVLVLEDYLSTRGAWIEGGAMLEARAVSIQFSRVVTPDDDSEPLDLGASETQAALHTARADGVSVLAWRGAALGDEATPVFAPSTSTAEKARRALSHILQGHDYAATDLAAGTAAWKTWSAANFEGSLPPGISESAYAVRYAMRSGVVQAGAYAHLLLPGLSSLSLPCDCRLYAFAAVGPTAAGPGEAPFTAPPPALLLSPAAVAGTLRSVPCGASTLARVGFADLLSDEAPPASLSLAAPVLVPTPGPALVTVLLALVPQGWGGGVSAAVGAIPALSFSPAPQTVPDDGDRACLYTPASGQTIIPQTAAGVHAAVANTNLYRSDSPWVPAHHLAADTYEEGEAALSLPGVTIPASSIGAAAFVTRSAFTATEENTSVFHGTAYYQSPGGTPTSVSVTAHYRPSASSPWVPVVATITRAGGGTIAAQLNVTPADAEFAVESISPRTFPISVKLAASRAILSATANTAFDLGEISLAV